MLIIDTSHPLYRRLWVRLLIVGFCAAWSVIEFVNREFFWGTVVGGVAVYAAYELLLKFRLTRPGTNQTSQWKAHPRIETTPAEASFPGVKPLPASTGNVHGFAASGSPGQSGDLPLSCAASHCAGIPVSLRRDD